MFLNDLFEIAFFKKTFFILEFKDISKPRKATIDVLKGCWFSTFDLHYKWLPVIFVVIKDEVTQ